MADSDNIGATATPATLDSLSADLRQLLKHFNSLATVVEDQQMKIRLIMTNSAAKSDQTQSIAADSGNAESSQESIVKTENRTNIADDTPVNDGRHLHSALPRRKLDFLDFHPNENPVKFREWIRAAVIYQRHYRLHDEIAIAELEWYGRRIIGHRIETIRQAQPDASFQAICDQLVASASPAGLVRTRYRNLHRCQQLDNEAGNSFVTRFEEAVMQYQEHATTELVKSTRRLLPP
jgi:hypothetical protein